LWEGSITTKEGEQNVITEQAAAFIAPMKEWASIGEAARTEPGREKTETSLFADVLNKTVQQVYDTQAEVEEKQYLLAAGKLDDAHSLPIAQAKASISLDVLISLRNKALESYNELLKMNV
jgi:flagellar hook-basal body complex protein FliE